MRGNLAAFASRWNSLLSHSGSSIVPSSRVSTRAISVQASPHRSGSSSCQVRCARSTATVTVEFERAPLEALFVSATSVGVRSTITTVCTTERRPVSRSRRPTTACTPRSTASRSWKAAASRQTGDAPRWRPGTRGSTPATTPSSRGGAPAAGRRRPRRCGPPRPCGPHRPGPCGERVNTADRVRRQWPVALAVVEKAGVEAVQMARGQLLQRHTPKRRQHVRLGELLVHRRGGRPPGSADGRASRPPSLPYCLLPGPHVLAAVHPGERVVQLLLRVPLPSLHIRGRLRWDRTR